MRTAITWGSPGIDGGRTSCSAVIVDFDSESVVSRNSCYTSHGCETDPKPNTRRR